MKEQKEISMLYKKLAEQYLFEVYSIRRLEERFAECEVKFLPESETEQENKLALKFISLLNKAHIERLDENERKSLEEISKGNTEINIAEFIDSTYVKVLAGDIRKNVQYEYFKNIYGKGILPGNAIVFFFRDKVEYNAENQVNWETEYRKDKIFHNVKTQFEKMANRKSQSPIYLIRE